MKPFLENNGAAIYVGRATTAREQTSVLVFTPQLNVSIGQFLQHFENLLWFVYGQGEKSKQNI